MDTSAWINYFNGIISGETDTLDNLLGEQLIIMGDLILIETLQGFRSDKQFNRARRILSSLPFYEMIGYDISIQSAKNYRLLRKRGVTVRKTIDVIIGTFCISNGITLLHSDADFLPMVQFLGLRELPIKTHY